MANIEGYEHVYNVRPPLPDNDRRTGGGLSLFIKNGVSFKECKHLNVMETFMETLFIEVSRNDKLYIIGLIYRIPNTSSVAFINKLNDIIEPIKNDHEVILLGDFNIDLLQNNSHSIDFQNMMQSN